MWGPVRNGLRCMDCGNSYHEKCSDSVPNNCTKYKTVEGSQSTMANRNQGDNVSVVSSNVSTGPTSNDIYRTFDSNVPENRTHEGYASYFKYSLLILFLTIFYSSQVLVQERSIAKGMETAMVCFRFHQTSTEILRHNGGFNLQRSYR